MNIGYILESRHCNTSYEEQEKVLKNYGCEKILGDRISRFNQSKNFPKLLPLIDKDFTLVICEQSVFIPSYGQSTFMKNIIKKGAKIHFVKENKTVDHFPEKRINIGRK